MRLSRREILFWCAVSALVLVANVVRAGRPMYDVDSYQYLSAAENIRAGNGAATSIVSFDVERLSGRVPAPLTTFPPGYSFAIALLDGAGLEADQAGALVSMISFIALFPLLAWGARILSLGPLLTRLVFVWLLANSWVAEYPVQILSESTFAALTTAAVVALMAAERRDQTPARRRRALLLGCVLAGLSYWVRYAGLFLFASMVAYFALKALVRRDRRSLAALACCAVPLGMIGTGVLRNLLLTESWQGGNTKRVLNPILPVLEKFVASIYHLVFGQKVAARFGPAELLFVVSALTLVVLAVHALRERPLLGVRRSPYRTSLAFLSGYLAIYCAGMIYAGVTSVISFGTRMFYPLLPLLLLAAAHVVGSVEGAISRRSLRRPALAGATALLTMSYCVINVRSLQVEPSPTPAEVLDARFAVPAADGRPLRAWIEEHVPPDAVIITTEAHATAYVLERRTVALTPAEYSDSHWAEAEVRALMASYGADLLTLYPTSRSGPSAAQRESPFLASLLEGDCPPWLALVAENPHVKIFRRLPARDPSSDTRPASLVIEER